MKTFGELSKHDQDALFSTPPRNLQWHDVTGRDVWYEMESAELLPDRVYRVKPGRVGTLACRQPSHPIETMLAQDLAGFSTVVAFDHISTISVHKANRAYTDVRHTNGLKTTIRTNFDEVHESWNEYLVSRGRR